jgi:transposase InsO family protein
MVCSLKEWYGYPIRRACELVGLAHSSYYYHGQRVDESRLVADLEEVCGQHVTYGTRRVCHQLRRPPYGYRINRKRVQRIMRQKGLLKPVKRRRRWTTNSDHPYPRYPNLVKELAITRPEQLWVCDITYIRLGQGFVYLAIVMDVFTRAIRGWHLSKLLDQELSLAALRMALTDRIPEIHHSDQGVHYAAHAYIDLLKAHRIQISMAAVGKAEENGYAERFMRTIKEEEVDLSDYLDFVDALSQIGQFIEDVYNHKRIHSSLGYLTSVEFEAAWLASQLEMGTP